jgi:Fe-S-cluster-containing hydrogenase component 2
MFQVDQEKCIGCEACVGVCPVGAISMVNGKAMIDGSQCVDCGRCVEICFQGAIYQYAKSQKSFVPNQGQSFPDSNFGMGRGMGRGLGRGMGRGLGIGSRNGRGRGRGGGGRRR